MSFLSIMPSQMHIQFYSSYEFPFTEGTLKWFLSSVDPNMYFYVSFCEESFFADLANERSYPAMHHLYVFCKAKAVDKSLPAMLADMYPTITVHPAVAFKALGVWEILPTECA